MYWQRGGEASLGCGRGLTGDIPLRAEREGMWDFEIFKCYATLGRSNKDAAAQRRSSTRLPKSKSTAAATRLRGCTRMELMVVELLVPLQNPRAPLED